MEQSEQSSEIRYYKSDTLGSIIDPRSGYRVRQIVNMIILYLLYLTHHALREILRLYYRTNTPRTRLLQELSSLVVSLHICFVLLSPICRYLAVGNYQAREFYILGIVLMLVGMGVHIVAMITLQEFFSGNLTTIPSQQVVKSGPYQWVRHPGYLGAFLVTIGFGLGTQNILSFMIVTISFTICYSYRIRQEERMMLKTFSTDYSEYQKTTRYILPWVL